MYMVQYPQDQRAEHNDPWGLHVQFDQVDTVLLL